MARQAARSVLPNATETKIFVTANARALRHFIEMRCSEHAEVEIRKVAAEVLRVMQKEAPNLFGDYELGRCRTAHSRPAPPIRRCDTGPRGYCAIMSPRGLLTPRGLHLFPSATGQPQSAADLRRSASSDQPAEQPHWNATALPSPPLLLSSSNCFLPCPLLSLSASLPSQDFSSLSSIADETPPAPLRILNNLADLASRQARRFAAIRDSRNREPVASKSQKRG